MQLKSSVLAVFGLVLIGTVCRPVHAASNIDELRSEVEDLRKRINDKPAATSTAHIESMVGNKYGPSKEVGTKNGKLTLGGLLQVWNYSIKNDHADVFGRRTNTVGTGGTSEASDNNGYRIRRAELKFTLDIHENITAVVMLDAARDATSFAALPSNQGNFKSKAAVAPEFDAANGPGLGSTAAVAGVQNGSGQAGRLLQDAYINYHDFVPHHDFTIGQFFPPTGEEATRNSAYLDFAERAMVTQVSHLRDIGVQVHGSWWDDDGKQNGRVQYWAGLFNTPGTFFGTGGDFQNRSDDNDSKDFSGRILVRPLWNCGVWGNLELGLSGQFGTHGEAGDLTGDGTGPINGLNRLSTSAVREAAWVFYKPMGPVRGWWLRSEWGYQKDRATPLSVNAFALGSGPNGEQAAPNPFHRDGWYFSTGYKLTDSVFGDRLSKGGFWNNLLQPVEFAFRYETFQNIVTEDLVKPDTHTDLFSTTVWTAGVNYYLKAYNARVQVNYILVNEQEDKVNQAARGFEEVKNNAFVVTYQVAF